MQPIPFNPIDSLQYDLLNNADHVLTTVDTFPYNTGASGGALWPGGDVDLLCGTDTTSGFKHIRARHQWPESEITIRLSLRGDEVWVIAGSGTLIRFVADSESEFDGDSIATVLTRILAGEAVEYFGVAEQHDGDTFATGYRVGDEGFAGGFAPDEAKFHARLAGPLAVAALDLPE